MNDNLETMRMRIINRAIETGIITEEDYEKYGNKYIDEYGINSFVNFVEALIGEATAFITTNEKLLKDRKLLEAKYGVPIKTPGEIGLI